LTLGNFNNTLTATGVETITGDNGNDTVTLGAGLSGTTSIVLGGGTDILNLANGGQNLTLGGDIETVVVLRADLVTLSAAVNGNVYNLGGGSDALTLAGAGNTVTLSGVETTEQAAPGRTW